MARSKPVCGKCGQPHWNMIRCAEVPEENAREEAKAAAAAAARVVPEVRSRPARQPVLISRNFIQQAPGVYRRRRRAA